MNTTSLIIIDIQNDYFDNGANPLEGSFEASLNAKMMLEYAREMNMLVVHVQHLSTRPDATFFIPDSKGAEIHTNVKPIEGEKVIKKNFPNSFRDTELLDYLKQNCVDQIVVCGMMTHMCVDATVRAAKDFGFTCTLISDACATRDLEIDGFQVKAHDVHKAFLAALNYFYANVTTTYKYIK